VYLVVAHQGFSKVLSTFVDQLCSSGQHFEHVIKGEGTTTDVLYFRHTCEKCFEQDHVNNTVEVGICIIFIKCSIILSVEGAELKSSLKRLRV
jgi:hypothetical protein